MWRQPARCKCGYHYTRVVRREGRTELRHINCLTQNRLILAMNARQKSGTSDLLRRSHETHFAVLEEVTRKWSWPIWCTILATVSVRRSAAHEIVIMVRVLPIGYPQLLRACIKKFPDWPPGARTTNNTALCHYAQLYHLFEPVQWVLPP
jgi:hypothetical protein